MPTLLGGLAQSVSKSTEPLLKFGQLGGDVLDLLAEFAKFGTRLVEFRGDVDGFRSIAHPRTSVRPDRHSSGLLQVTYRRHGGVDRHAVVPRELAIRRQRITRTQGTGVDQRQ